MLFGIAIGKRGKTERARVGRHMETIGEQRHRPSPVARRDFGDHHHRGQRDDPQGALRILIVRRAAEVVQMLGGRGFGPSDYLFRIAAYSTKIGSASLRERVYQYGGIT